MKKVEEDVNLERAKFEYCAKLYKQVSDNFEYLERKAQLFFSFVTIFLGAIILNTNFIETTRKGIQNSQLGEIGNYILYISLGFLVTFIFLALIALAGTIRGQYWMVEHPDNLAFSLYAPNSEFLESQSEVSFLKAMGYGYTLAIEHNRKINDKKYAHLEMATWCIYVAIFSLFVFLVLLFLSSTL